MEVVFFLRNNINNSSPLENAFFVVFLKGGTMCVILK